MGWIKGLEWNRLTIIFKLSLQMIWNYFAGDAN